MNRSKGLARFAFMHCIASSLCAWFYAIINETLDSIVNKTFIDVTPYKNESCTSHFDDGLAGSFAANGGHGMTKAGGEERGESAAAAAAAESPRCSAA